MKKPFITLALIIAFGVGMLVTRLIAAESPGHAPGRYEYVTIRWGGRDNTHIIRPGGKVEFVRDELRRVERPDRSDDRALYMNVIMNGLVKEGWEFAGMTSDEIVMKRGI
ncbi:hypothetical protein GC207_11565 [bacterium]|nr:hypothetical protein [bacterium]